MKLSLTILGTFVLLVGLASPGFAECVWTEDFDGYANGSGIIGQGGWEGWDGNPASDGFVTNFVSNSAPHSLASVPTTDVIQQFSGYTSGQYTISAWNYIPGNATGEQYFLLLNTYNHGGPYNWSTQILFADGLVLSQNENLFLPLLYDQWVELLVEIDLDADTQSIYYGGNLLSTKSWTEGVSGGGVPEIACVDIFSNGGDEVYWDDFCLADLTTAVESSSWSAVKSLF
jgi:hypothetical protein